MKTLKTVYDRMEELKEQEQKIRNLIIQNATDDGIMEKRFKVDEINRLLDELTKIQRQQISVMTKA